VGAAPGPHPALNTPAPRTPRLPGASRWVMVGGMTAPPEGETSLPRRPDLPLRGRGPTLVRLEELLEERRWVSVVGPIGVGKTRLVLELAHRARDGDQRIAWLAPADGGAGTSSSLRSLPAPAPGRALLVLDGDGAPPRALAGELAAWLAADPGRRVVTGRRRPIGHPDETVLTLDRVDRAAGREILRAHLARDQRETAPGEDADRGGGGLGGGDGDLDRVVDAVDGLPLLLAWVAPFVVRLGADRLADKLDLDPFLVFAEGPDVAPPRHRRLRDALAEPIQALPAALLQVLADASLFHGPFRVEDAHAVIPAPASDGPGGRGGDALEAALAALAVRGLLRSGRSGDGTPWFAPWALVRAALRGESAALGGIAPDAAVRRRYEDHVLALAAAGTDPAPLGLAEELDGIAHRCAAQARVGADPETLRRAVGAATELALAVLDRAPLERAAGLLDELLGHPSAGGNGGAVRSIDPGSRARGWWARGRLGLRVGGGPGAVDDLRRAATLASDAGRDDLAGQARCDLGRALVTARHPEEARAEYREAARLLRSAGDMAGSARVEAHRAALAQELGDLAEARRAYEAALALSEETDDRVTAGVAMQNLGLIDLEAGDRERAADRFDRALATHREVGHRRFEGVAAADRGLLRLGQGRPAAARRLLVQATEVLRETGDLEGRLVAQARLAGSLAELGRIRRSRALVDRTLREAASRGLGRIRRVAALEGAHVDLVVAREAWAWEEPGRLEDERHAAAAVARAADDRSDEQVRLSRARLDDAIAATHRLARALVVDADGAWMRPPASGRVDLRRSPVLRAVLRALVAARLDLGGPLGRDQLREAAWPDERMRPASARNRLDVALSKLRGQGLEGILVRDDAGYRLDPRVPVLMAMPRRPRG